MIISESKIRHLIREALTKSERSSIEVIARREARKIFSDKFDKFEQRFEKEIEKQIKGKINQEEIVDVTKKLLIKLYKELAFNQPHIIRQVRV
jgi:hypothetical protein